MASVNLPEKCLNDPGRGKAWLLTAVGHYGGQEVIEEVEKAIRIATLKGIEWKTIIEQSLPVVGKIIAGKEPSIIVTTAIEAIPAPPIADAV